MNRFLPSAVAVAAVTTSLSLTSATPAVPDVANPRASCVGLSLSDHAVNDRPGAIAETAAWLRDNADGFGFRNSGQIVSRFAKVHAGSHMPGCEEAIVGVLLTGP